MTLKHHVVAALLRLYPRAWREEYGAEFADTLFARPLTVGVINDVVWSAAGERARRAGLPTLLGLAGSVVIGAWLSANLIAPPARQDAWTWLLQNSGMTLPTLIIAPLRSTVAMVLATTFGWWSTEYREASRGQVVRDTAWMWTLAGLPVTLYAAALALGLVVNPDPSRYRALAMFFAPLFNLPLAMMFASFGTRRRRHRSTITELHLHETQC